MSETLDVGSLDEAGRKALERLITSVADSKRLMGIRYSDWLLGAPSLETGIAASSMTQDEWGHARLLYAMLKDVGIDPEAVEHDRSGEAYASLAALDGPCPDWAALVAAIVLADGALTVMLTSLAEGTYETARTRIPKMLGEEVFHSALGAAWYRRLAGANGEARRLLTAATEAMLPSTLAWVGADDGPARTVAEMGVVPPAADRLGAFKDAIRDLVALVGLDVDAVERAADWDGARGRTGGRPDEESVERARGDRNRALLVESM